MHVIFGIVSYRIVSYRIVSYRIVSYRIVSYRIVSYRIISHCTVSYRIVSYRIIRSLASLLHSSLPISHTFLYIIISSTNQLTQHSIDDDSMGDDTLNAFSVKTTVGGMCNNCRDDDSTGSFESLLSKDATAELEVDFCNKIQSAGSKYLNSAKSCSIKFDADAEQVALKSNASNNVAKIGNTLILKGVAGDATSKEDLAIIAKAFVSAYNDVHWDANHYLADAEIPFSAGSPDSGMCNNCIDDDSIDAMTKTLVLDIVTPVVDGMCNNCKDDDSMGTQFNMATLKSSKFNKKMVEVAFCKKLQNSVSAELSLTKKCSIAVESVIQSTDTSTKAW